ncbi:putative glutathione S-transferase parA [Cinnamomum micranthum f. kanehirae]|uniref:glutathione transferase n=1 Tax=Cinnamomum micranthum f. kanehirae TaxID=337451 RepID=A0A3S4NUG8_9MAGN|nr:putative glutathione S-transferase parA [Cinnamomum micranthum f. kanehirae]
MAKEEVVVLDFWPKCEIALEEKGVQYQFKESNPFDKSDLLLKSNPVHKKVPVLIHSNKPICESLNIVLYIDETWNGKSPLMPQDPYDRANARFWADYVDKNVLEGELGEKSIFGGHRFGFVDVFLIPFGCWFYAYETCGNFSVEKECPKPMAWVKRCMKRESVSKTLADPLKIHEYVELGLKKRYGVE